MNIVAYIGYMYLLDFVHHSTHI